MIRTAAIAAAAVAALGGGALAARPTSPAPASAGRSDVRFEGVRLWVFQGSRLRSVGSADEVTYDRAAGVGRASRPAADFLGKTASAAPVHMTAGSAEGHVLGRTLDARDGTNLRRQDGTATTRAAHYDGLSHLASGADPVQVQTSQFQVQGEGGFRLDTQSQLLDLNGPVSARGEVQQ